MKRISLAGAAVAVTVLATACSSGTGTSAGSAPASGTGNKVVGIVTISATDSNNAKVIAGVKGAAQKKGWTVNVVDAQGNADQANSAMRTFATQKVGMIFDLVFPATSLGAGLAAARTAGVPVASWGGGLANGVVMTTGDGAPFAEPSVKALLDDMGDSGSVLALTYRTGQVCRDREKIFDQALQGKSGIPVTKNEVTIPGFLQDGQRYANAWLAKNPAGSGKLAIWGCWEDPTLGAIAALKQQGRTDVKTFGINGSPQAIKAVKDGSLTATVWEDGGKEGAAMFETTLEAISAGSSWKQKTVDVPGVLVTSDTIDQFLTEHPDAAN